MLPPIFALKFPPDHTIRVPARSFRVPARSLLVSSCLFVLSFIQHSTLFTSPLAMAYVIYAIPFHFSSPTLTISQIQPSNEFPSIIIHNGHRRRLNDDMGSHNMDLLSHPAHLSHLTLPPELSQVGTMGNDSRRQDILHTCVSWIVVHSISPCVYRSKFVSFWCGKSIYPVGI